MTMKPARAALGATLLLALAVLWGCVPDSREIPEPTGQPGLDAPAGITAIRVVTVSDMATTAVRVDERSATSRTRTLARQGHHYYDVILRVPTSLVDGPASSRIGAPELVADGVRFQVVDSVVLRRPAVPWAHLIAEFEVPLGSRPESIRIPSGGSGDAVISLPLP